MGNKVPVQDTKTVCEAGYEKKCENEWVCLDYPKQDNLDYCQNKKWQPTNYGCKTNAEMFPLPDTRIKRNVEPFISKSPLKSLERLPSENALDNHPMNTLPKKSENMISQAINLTVRSLIYTKNGNRI